MNYFRQIGIAFLMSIFVFGMQSCEKEEMDDPKQSTSAQKSTTFNYEFNNGQLIPSAAYSGMHSDKLSATVMVKGKTENTATITVTLMNTIKGEMYMVHAHDAADPSNTPNGTPYNESPNADVFVQMAEGNGGNVELTQDVDMSFSEITMAYEGFFVVHDPLQPVNTADVSTYLVVGAFAREQSATSYDSKTFSYTFNTGQLNSAFAYNGSHPMTLSADIRVQELADGSSRISVMLDNTINGETYMVHAHDVADPSTTPNGTPYNETPNSDVCTLKINGTGMSAMSAQISSLSYANITSTYEGFFVVHDPLQGVDTTDPTTYVILGLFARS